MKGENSGQNRKKFKYEGVEDSKLYNDCNLR